MKTDINQLEFVDNTLREILIWLESATGLEYTITSIHRIGDEGVHGTLPVRGIDVRMRNHTIGQAIATFINNNWQYDPERPLLECAILHGTVLHLHIQAHANTRRL